MKKMAFHEGLKNNLYTSLKEMVIDILQEKYLVAESLALAAECDQLAIRYKALVSAYDSAVSAKEE